MERRKSENTRGRFKLNSEFTTNVVGKEEFRPSNVAKSQKKKKKNERMQPRMNQDVVLLPC